MPSSEADIIMF